MSVQTATNNIIHRLAPTLKKIAADPSEDILKQIQAANKETKDEVIKNLKQTTKVLENKNIFEKAWDKIVAPFKWAYNQVKEGFNKLFGKSTEKPKAETSKPETTAEPQPETQTQEKSGTQAA